MEEKQKIESFKDLEAWKEGHKLVLMIYTITKLFPKEEIFGIVNQIRRAVVSITSNLAEGFSRQSPKEKTQFYSIAKGSLTEVQNQLLISKDVGYITDTEYKKVEDQSIKASKLITGLLKYTRTLSVFLLPFILYTIPFIPKVAEASATLQRPPTYNLGLVGYWTFDGKDTPWTSATAGTATDLSGNGNTGTLTNMNRSTSPALGKLGQALKLDGTNNYINAGSASSLDDISPLSISVWTKPIACVGSGSRGPLVSKVDANSGGHGWIFEETTANSTCTVQFSVRGFPTTDLDVRAANSSVTINEWTHWVVTWDGTPTSSNVHIYKNGTEVTYAAQTDGVGTLQSDASRSLLIGADTDLSRYSNAIIDEVRVYNRALSATEVAQLYQAGAVKVNASSADLDNGSSLEQGLAGHWTLDGADTYWSSATTATTTDRSAYGHNGTVTNMNRATAGAVGKLGQALKFDGSNDFIKTGNVTFGSTVYSVSAWVKPATTSPNTIFSYGNVGSTNRFEMQIQSSHLRFYDDTSGGASGSVSIPVNAWTFVTVTFDGSNKRLYVNAIQDGSPAASAYDPSTNNGPYYIGSDVGGSDNFFNGLIDDVRLYNRTLSASEISQLYNLGTATANASQNVTHGSLDSGLVGLWSFDGPDISWPTIYDRSGQGNNGTLTNMSRSTSPVSGKVGQALSFDGVDDDLRENNVLAVPSAFSFSCWMKTTSASNHVFDWGFTRFASTHFSPGKLSFTVDGDSTGAVLSTTSVNDGVWHYVTFVNNGNNQTLYIDGVQESTATETLNTTAAWIDFGSSYNTTDGSYRGLLDEVRMYNRALSASEVKQLYNMGR